MKQVSIIGLGLIGGSIGLALKRAAPELRLVGFTRSDSTAEKACDRGAIDATARDPASAVAQANVVFIATPVRSIPDILRQIAGHLPPGCVVTDTASTKTQVMAWAREYLPPGAQFVGGHPMAGKETAGIDAADADLFRQCTYCLAPGQGISDESLRLVSGLVETLGARPLVMEAERHDHLVAAVSHLPILVSTALFGTARNDDSWPLMSLLAASGFRDTTRLASSDPKMHRDICDTNREAIASWVDRFIEELTRLRRLAMDDGEGLEQALSRVHDARQDWLAQRYPARDTTS